MKRNDLRTLSQKKSYDLLYRNIPQNRKSNKEQITPDNIPPREPKVEGTLENKIESLKDILKFELNTADRLTIFDVYNYFKAPMAKPCYGYERIVGEDNLGILLTLAVSNNLCFGIEGAPGSSKTLHMKKILSLLNKDEIYITSQATESVLFEDCEKINEKNYLIFTELQKIGLNQKRAKGGRLMEALKDLGEGREAVLKKVVGSQVEERIIYPKPFGYSRATTNPWDSDKEFKRRVIIFYTSNEHREEVNKTIYGDMHKIWTELREVDLLERQLREYISQIRQQKNIIMFDPYGDCLNTIIPDTSYSTCHIPHYQNMLTASARFNMQDRLKFSVGKYTYIIAEIEDHYTIYKIYHSLFINVLKDLAAKEEQHKFDNLIEPDWQQWFENGCEFMKHHSDAEIIRKKVPSLVGDYIGKQLNGNEILALNYMIGKKEPIGKLASNLLN